MNTKQRDPLLNEILYPLYDEKRCTEIITDYEMDPTAKEESKFSGQILLCDYLLFFFDINIR